jgi:hypothetical protein
MLIGCRAGEIGGLRLDEIRDDVIVLPATRTKNKRAHLVASSSRRGRRGPVRRAAEAMRFQSWSVIWSVGTAEPWAIDHPAINNPSKVKTFEGWSTA